MGNFDAVKNPCEDDGDISCTTMFATPALAVETHGQMAALGMTMPIMDLRVNSLFVNGAWSEPVPVVSGWTIEEPDNALDMTMSCGVNLEARTFFPVEVETPMPAMYIDAAIPEGVTTVPSIPPGGGVGPTCSDPLAALVGTLCVT